MKARTLDNRTQGGVHGDDGHGCAQRLANCCSVLPGANLQILGDDGSDGARPRGQQTARGCCVCA
jgi:hypothetical protein